MNKIPVFLAMVLFAGCYAQLTPGQGALLTGLALPFILNAGQFSSGQGILPPPIVGGGQMIYPGQGPIISKYNDLYHRKWSLS